MALRIYRHAHATTLNPSLAGTLQHRWKRNEMNELLAVLFIFYEGDGSDYVSFTDDSDKIQTKVTVICNCIIQVAKHSVRLQIKTLITYPVVICEAYVFRRCQYKVDVRRQNLSDGEGIMRRNSDWIIIVQ